jgi:hypothetical protein
MKRIVHALLVTGALGVAQVHAACDYPVAPGKFPDGSVASKDEMLAAKGQVVKYNDDMTKYLECIKGEYDAKVAATTDIKPDQKADMDKKQAQKEEAAVKEVTDVTERFNEQLRAWKSKNVPEKKAS